MRFEEGMEFVAEGFELVGVIIITLGGAYALLHSFRPTRLSDSYFERARRTFGRPLLLGLEILVAADIIKTITVDPSFEAAAVLGILVLVRVVLSFSLDIEIDGVLPWRRTDPRPRTEEAA